MIDCVLLRGGEASRCPPLRASDYDCKKAPERISSREKEKERCPERRTLKRMVQSVMERAPGVEWSLARANPQINGLPSLAPSPASSRSFPDVREWVVE